jgi:hypothetical protein
VASSQFAHERHPPSGFVAFAIDVIGRHGRSAGRITGTGGKDKTAVLGILERGGKLRTTVIENRKKKTLQAEVHAQVEAGSALYSDELLSCDGVANTQSGTAAGSDLRAWLLAAPEPQGDPQLA